MSAAGDLWVFGYGSLMWRPGFEFVSRHPARLIGYHRAFCISSTHHRGNARRPGLVLGLDRGGTCRGIVYRIAAADRDSVLAYLRKRELINGVYIERHMPVLLRDGSHEHVFAVCYVAERAHPSYVGHLPLAVRAHQIRGARGISGANLDYLVSTVADLRARGIREPDLERLAAIAGVHTGRLMRPDHTSPVSEGIRRAVCCLPDPALRLRPADRRRFLYRLKLRG